MCLLASTILIIILKQLAMQCLLQLPLRQFNRRRQRRQLSRHSNNSNSRHNNNNSNNNNSTTK